VSAPARAEAGFSLLEAVVALTIVGVTSVSVLAAFGAELRASDRGRHALEARALADDRLARLRLASIRDLEPLADSLRHGRFASPFQAYEWEARSHTVPGRTDVIDLMVDVRWEAGAFAEGTRLYRPGVSVTPP
jgi:type II secretory pathway pseudopilin PulG